MDFPYLARVAALNAASLASLAWAPAPPDSVRIGGAVEPSTTLAWSPVHAPDLLGYRVLWRRPTEPQWSRSLFVGNDTTTILPGVVVDDYFFAVAAVDREGNESLAVFPTGNR
jgi:hypothetical protein